MRTPFLDRLVVRAHIRNGALVGVEKCAMAPHLNTQRIIMTVLEELVVHPHRVCGRVIKNNLRTHMSAHDFDTQAHTRQWSFLSAKSSCGGTTTSFSPKKVYWQNTKFARLDGRFDAPMILT
jgi:hypothetical protein